jgi:hypothetical protein
MGCVSKLHSLLFDHDGSSNGSSSYLVLSYERPPATIILEMSGQSFEQVLRRLCSSRARFHLCNRSILMVWMHPPQLYLPLLRFQRRCCHRQPQQALRNCNGGCKSPRLT